MPVLELVRSRVRDGLPRGTPLPDADGARRHRTINSLAPGSCSRPSCWSARRPCWSTSAIVFILVHHGVAGATDPMSVYNHSSAIFQGDQSSTRAADGVGLGLHIVPRVVTAAGGDIAISCEDGITPFTVWIPAPTPRIESVPRQAAATVA